MTSAPSGSHAAVDQSCGAQEASAAFKTATDRGHRDGRSLFGCDLDPTRRVFGGWNGVREIVNVQGALRNSGQSARIVRSSPAP
jgi:hypothetical protein